MLTDTYGLVLSTGSVAARDAYVDAVDAMLTARGGAASALEQALSADPEFALAHAALARMHQLFGRLEDARRAVGEACRLAPAATVREQRHIEICRLLCLGGGAQTLRRITEHAKEHPRDALALAPASSVFGLIGFSGRVDREHEQLALLEPLARHYGDDAWFLSVHGFALIEVGRCAKTKRLLQWAVVARKAARWSSPRSLGARTTPTARTCMPTRSTKPVRTRRRRSF